MSKNLKAICLLVGGVIGAGIGFAQPSPTYQTIAFGAIIGAVVVEVILDMV